MAWRAKGYPDAGRHADNADNLLWYLYRTNAQQVWFAHYIGNRSYRVPWSDFKSGSLIQAAYRVLNAYNVTGLRAAYWGGLINSNDGEINESNFEQMAFLDYEGSEAASTRSLIGWDDHRQGIGPIRVGARNSLQIISHSIDLPGDINGPSVVSVFGDLSLIHI